ncbi:15876_t:CDS:2 [Cetraspora pellucida]|uniref:15876_t:CDS:1 n=1 Tax=Cetraspora pellucida TaxID=1433469 RepID=A0ACA9K6W7_9GLOM|nr:15876_t:CDS:2 [Cetraspora pellucida]
MTKNDESNSDLEEISDNDLEIEMPTVLCENRQDQSRLARVSQGASNSCSHGSHGSSSRGRNSCRHNSCTTVSYEEIESSVNSQDTLLEQQEQDVNTLVMNLTSQDSDPEIKIKEKLDDSKIVEVVLDETNQYKNRNPDDSDKEESEISISEKLMGLNKFISFFEQQTDSNFKAEDLKIF